MARTSIFFLCLSAAVLLAAGDKCLGLGQACTCDFVSGAVCSDPTSVCQFPYYCIDGACALSGDGSYCTTDAECQRYTAARGLGVSVCNNSRCLMVGSYGDSCAEDAHCRGAMKCDKKTRRCEALPLGASCDPLLSGPGDAVLGAAGAECGPDAFCSKEGKCTYAPHRYQRCDSDSPCAANAACQDGTCIEMFSAGPGENCSDLRTCKKGLVCGPAGVCESPRKKVYKHCEQDTDCGEGTTGKCVAADPHFIDRKYCETVQEPDADCAKKLVVLVTCLVRHNCSLYLSTELDSCGQQSCPDEVHSYYGCLDNCAKYQDIIGKQCIAGDVHRECPNISAELLMIIEFSALIGIVIVIVIAFATFKIGKKIMSKK